jgi:type IV pilus assembly protein PilW
VNYHKSKNSLNNSGFTLLELLIVMAITGIVMAAVYSASKTQQDSYIAQEEVATMQQNVRSAMYYMERETRMAGCHPTQKSISPLPGIVTAGPNTINFTLDIDDNSGTGNPDGDVNDPNENITYALADNDGDGDLDFERNSNLIAENIDALDFVYYDNSNPPAILDDDGTGNVVANINRIKSVEITIIARVGRDDRKYVDNNVYTNQNGRIILDLSANPDNFRRRVLTTVINCRNL